MSVIKPKPKQLLWPITRDASSTMTQSEYQAIISSRGKAQKNVRMYVAIGFTFVSHCLKKWHELCWPIIERHDAKSKQMHLLSIVNRKPLYLSLVGARRNVCSKFLYLISAGQIGFSTTTQRNYTFSINLNPFYKRMFNCFFRSKVCHS